MNINNSKVVLKIKGFFSKFRKLNNDDLEKVTGAGEPEEFDWKTKGYTTPIKTDPEDLDWTFEALGQNYVPDIHKAKLDAIKNKQRIQNDYIKKNSSRTGK